MKLQFVIRFFLFFAILSLFSIMVSMFMLNRPSEPQPYTVGIIIANEDRYKKVAGFKTGMEELGFLENRDVEYITINLRGKRSISDEELLKNIQHHTFDVVISTGAWETNLAKQMIPNTPIVFAGIASPENLNWIKDLFISGIDNGQIKLIGKRMELIKHWIPTAKRIMVIADSNAPITEKALEEVEKSSKKLRLQTEIYHIGSRVGELKNILEQITPGQYDALLTLPSFILEDSITDLVPLLVEKRLFTIGSYPEQANRGLFASYGVSFFEQGKQASILAATILDGRVPAIPYEIPDSIQISIHKANLDQLGIELTDQQISLVHQLTGVETP